MPVLISREGAVLGRRGRLFSLSLFAFVAAFTGSIVLLLAFDAGYIKGGAGMSVLLSREIRAATWLSLWTTTLSAALSVLFAVPMGYALSRYRFPGRMFVDTIVDLPIVFPPLVLGLSLLVFFRTPPGLWIEEHVMEFVYHRSGIVLAQFLTCASFAIRACKTSFDDIDRREEDVALTLGCTPYRAFRMVAVPNARNGIVAGAALAWAKAFGVFGPLMVFVGAVRMRTEALPTTIYLETSIGHIETALAVSLLMIAIATLALLVIRRGGYRGLW